MMLVPLPGGARWPLLELEPRPVPRAAAAQSDAAISAQGNTLTSRRAVRFMERIRCVNQGKKTKDVGQDGRSSSSTSA